MRSGKEERNVAEDWKPFPLPIFRYVTWHLSDCSIFSYFVLNKVRIIATLDQCSVLHSCGAFEGITWANHTFVAGRSNQDKNINRGRIIAKPCDTIQNITSILREELFQISTTNRRCKQN